MKHSDAIAAIMRAVDIAIDPRRMTKLQALNFLRELDTEIESRIDALKDELKGEEEDT